MTGVIFPDRKAIEKELIRKGSEYADNADELRQIENQLDFLTSPHYAQTIKDFCVAEQARIAHRRMEIPVENENEHRHLVGQYAEAARMLESENDVLVRKEQLLRRQRDIEESSQNLEGQLDAPNT